jgi:phage terminase small subunit
MGEALVHAAKLTPKQARFVEEYLVDLNATQAAIRAGYSERTARQQGDRLLTNADIGAAIAKAQADRSERTEITQDQVLRELSRMGLYDPADIARHPMSGPADIVTLPEEVRRAIVGWGWDKSGNFTLKLANKQGALELIGKHLGMFKDEVKHSGSVLFQLDIPRPEPYVPQLPAGDEDDDG